MGKQIESVKPLFELRYKIHRLKQIIEYYREKQLMKNTDEWFKQEWKDADRILKLDREGLLWQIWKEISNKLMWAMIGVLFGLCLEDIALFFRGLF